MKEYLLIIRDIFCKFCIKTYAVTSYLNRFDKKIQMKGHHLNEMVQMRGHNIRFL